MITRGETTKRHALLSRHRAWVGQREMMRSRRYQGSVRGEPLGAHEATLRYRNAIVVDFDTVNCLRGTDFPDPRSYTKDVDGVGVIVTRGRSPKVPIALVPMPLRGLVRILVYPTVISHQICIFA